MIEQFFSNWHKKCSANQTNMTKPKLYIAEMAW